ncbi:hypothetical protein Aduo_018696 [Ancylostoma duodenale]
MLRKKTVIPADWDMLLPMVVFAYNSSPHSSTGESPFFLLHAFDPHYPSKVIPREELSPYQVDIDNYKTQFLNGLNSQRSAADCPGTIDFKCPGYYQHGDQQIKCPIEVPFSKLIRDPTIPELTFTSVYDSARAIAIVQSFHLPNEWKLHNS